MVVLNYNGLKVNEACLNSLRQEGTPGVEVLFVDNDSTDGSFEKAQQEYPEFVHQQNGTNLFFAGGNNRGLETVLSGDTEFIFILNNDTVVEPGCIDRLQTFLERHPEVGACQPLLCSMDNPEKIASGGCRLGGVGKAWDHACGQPLETVGDKPYQVLGVTGGAMLVRTSVLRSVGLFDESFQMYFEDVDLSLRMRNAGWELYCVPTARVLHKGSASTVALGMWRRAYYCERNSYRVMLNNFPPGRLAMGYARGVPLAIVASAYNILTGRWRYGWSILKAVLLGVLDGIASLPQVWQQRKRPCRFEERVDWKVGYPPCPTEPMEDTRPTGQ
ncbi:glycosyl transferase [Pseudodesulfovibrio sediminis]|uniref:Glycosyl transferase n=1 Tax=Pseudodesulfovibrio sediminis TaxID=2810563 RepID=A0ABM7P546_9BACT|nr:glycosyl transferase [Pseudodesulfovibrio sediminis]